MAKTPPAHIASDEVLSIVWQCMDTIAPLSLADTSWDNVGVLLQAPEPERNSGHKIFLANDLTTAVADEILEDGKVAVAIIYHPIIFRGLKALTLADSQQRTLLRLAAANISVYCPHTSLDAAVGGINDWLALVVSGYDSNSMRVRPAHPSKPASAVPPAHEGAGMGRVVTLTEPIKAEELVARVKRGTELKHVQVAVPPSWMMKGAAGAGHYSTIQDALQNNAQIRTIAVCAGSGSSVIGGIDADAYVTGEMSHHEILAATAQGRLVILTHHSNSERGYLRTVLPDRLRAEIGKLASGSSEEGGESGSSKRQDRARQLEIVVSQTDADPLLTI